MGDSNQKRTTDRLAGVQYTPVISCALDHRAGKWHSVHALVTPNKPAALQEACTLRTFCAPAPLPCAGALRRAVATGIKHNTTCISMLPTFRLYPCISPGFTHRGARAAVCTPSGTAVCGGDATHKWLSDLLSKNNIFVRAVAADTN
jgi:hypothetical protein